MWPLRRGRYHWERHTPPGVAFPDRLSELAGPGVRLAVHSAVSRESTTFVGDSLIKGTRRGIRRSGNATEWIPVASPRLSQAHEIVSFPVAANGIFGDKRHRRTPCHTARNTLPLSSRAIEDTGEEFALNSRSFNRVISADNSRWIIFRK